LYPKQSLDFVVPKEHASFHRIPQMCFLEIKPKNIFFFCKCIEYSFSFVGYILFLQGQGLNPDGFKSPLCCNNIT